MGKTERVYLHARQGDVKSVRENPFYTWMTD